MSRNRVDLPAPEGPTIAVNPPAGTVNETSWRAGASLVVAERDTFKTHLAGGGKPHRDVWLGKHSSREDLVDLGDRFTRSLDGQGRSTDILQHLRVAQRNPDESHRHDRVQRPDPPRFAASTMRVTAMPWAVNPKTKLANTPSHRSLRAARLLATWASWRG